ncbi:TIGR04206 family protein [Halorussus gelatinilyticus]|uniref:TIGR04206 family protein n=1 Tax=Halorussus gelatinilyticus TaxID=2937524 RepID=A0A8U0IG71_9EURY|nr:TIGR04206 family protein [Halorussus gelatinilyticus]UPV99273.1 TIGR04206 family protein [Halorussus gelatinilyticus]
MAADSRRALALLALAALPWTVLTSGDLVFAWGLATTDPIHVTTLSDYLLVYTQGLPNRLLAWPVAVLLYLLAVANAALGTVAPEREDRRVTGGLLALAGVSDLWFALGLRTPGLLAVPVGTVLLWTAACWFHWPDLRTALWQ